MTKCLTSHGLTFNQGETKEFGFAAFSCGGNKCIYGASSGPDSASQVIAFKRT